ncbi:cation-translocating P-type ATPase [Patescibacteria group bacterium]
MILGSKSADSVLRGGLSSSEVEKALKKFGPNEIEQEQKISKWHLLLGQFKSPLIYILFFAGLVSLVLSLVSPSHRQDWTDALVIFLAVGLNTALGFFQEFKAEKALQALKKFIVPHARVIRDGKQQQIEASQLVPGDVVVLLTGDKVPADGILLEAVDFFANEAVLTGESMPVSKKNKDEVFMGTAIASGHGKFQVLSTGRRTKIGGIATRLSQTVEEQTPLKKQLAHFSRILALVFSIVCLLLFLGGIWQGREVWEMFSLSVAVAVAAIPEGLVVSLTVILTLGMQRILKKKGLVRRLLAAETLGSVDVICVDKTGTLTEGKMKVVGQEVVGGEVGEKALAEGAILCNNLTNPLELAMMDWAKKELEESSLVQGFARQAEIPFSSSRKFMAVLVDSPKKGQSRLVLSGAPEVIMKMAALSPRLEKNWRRKLNQVTKKGFRVVGFAQRVGPVKVLKKDFAVLKKDFKNPTQNSTLSYQGAYLKLDWLGLLSFEDPIRLEVKESLRLCAQAGIKVKVITGDYRQTARTILDRLEVVPQGLKDAQIMEGWELEKITEEGLKERIEDIVLFARATPEQKIRIVQSLQEKGHSVAMMGDGVNDSLALKKADIGIVVGDASEVAKETADMVLLDSNFQTIVAAVEEGRGIFGNIKKVVLYLLSDSFTEVILIGGSLLLGLPAPLLPVQILWVNLVEDGLPGLALAFEPKDKGLMKDLPRPKNSPLLDTEIKTIIFSIGLMTDVLLFGTFFFLLRLGWPMSRIRTVIFGGLAIDSLLYVLSCKTLRKNLWEEELFSNWFLIWAIIAGLGFLLAGIYLPFFQLILKTVPLNLSIWFLILGLGGLDLLGIEVIKWLFLRKSRAPEK